MKKAISLILCAVIVLSFSACSKQAEEETTQTTAQTSTEAQSTTSPAGESSFSAAKGFEPFTCSEDDDFSIFCDIGSASYRIDTKTNSLIKSQNDNEQTVLTFDSDVKSCMLVGKTLFISCENGLYRLPVDDNGNCNADDLTVVISDVCCTPAYCLNNKMAVRVIGSQDDRYMLLDTQTGKYKANYDFNDYLDSDADVPSGLISSDKAGEAALEKIHSNQFKGYFSRENYSAVSSVTLVHYPDFYYGIEGTVWEFGKHSEYSYMVEIIADGEDISPKFTVFVNAYNSEIQFISFRKSQ